MIFYFYGENSFEISSAVKKLKDQYQAKTGAMLDVSELDMEEVPLAQLLNSLKVAPMFANSRLILLRGLSQNKVATARIAEIIDSVPNSTVLVIIDREVDRRSKYFKSLISHAKSRQFASLNPQKMRAFIVSYTSQLGGNITPMLAQKLYERVCHEYKSYDRASLAAAGDDQWKLSSEIEKLVSYNPTITQKAIELLVTANVDNSIFTLTDSIVSGRTRQALKLYTEIVNSGVSEQQIIAMLAWQYRIIIVAKLSLNQNDDVNLVKEFKISNYSLTRALNLGDKIDFRAVTKAYWLIIKADSRIKSGDSSASVAISELIYSLGQV